MNLHEFQGKALLARYGVAVPRNKMIERASDAEAAARELGTPVVVVKSQIHAGGRGAGAIVRSEADAAKVFNTNLAKEGLPKHDKPRGVQLAKSPAEAAKIAETLLGGTLVTKQTGSSGKTVRKVLIEEGCDIKRELYLSMLLDRAVGRLVFMASTEGGMDIEKVAEETPDKIFRVEIDPVTGLQEFQARNLAFKLGLDPEKLDEHVKFFSALYAAYCGLDAALLEINPLVETKSGSLLALDAKISLDDNAIFRHADLKALRDENEEDPKELKAAALDLSYIALTGTIGCMVNGAGLAMATMDIIHHHGGEPANFCDVGGGANAKKVAEAFKIILADPNVKAVFINIFGGIMQCDVLAQGVVDAAKEVQVKVPLVVRLEGTNVEKGREIIAKSGLAIISANGMTDGARKAVEASRKAA
jgi:succinyl-CoA synthetase beta subunit